MQYQYTGGGFLNKYDTPINLDEENSISLIIEQIKPNTQILEFGPATGRMTKYLKQVLHCDIYIVEIDAEAFELASQFATDGILGDIEKYEWFDAYRDLKFDYILFADVLEHLINPREVLAKVKDLLAEGGSIITSIPNIAHNSVILDLISNKFSYSKTGIMDSTHLRFFTYYTLQQLFDDCDLTIIKEKMVIMGLEQAGINNIPQSISDDYIELLKNRDFAFAYQFVFTSLDKEYYIKNKDNLTIEKCHKEDATGASLIQSIFIDEGKGYNEENKIASKLILDDTRFNLKVDINKTNTIGLRFDPCEFACRIKINNITSNINDLTISAANTSFTENGYDVFMHSDPIYILYSENLSEVKNIAINGEIIGISSFELQIFYQDLFNTVNTDKSLLLTKLNEKTDVIQEKENAILAINEKIVVITNEVAERNNEIINLNNVITNLKSELDLLRDYINEKKINLLQSNQDLNLVKTDMKQLYEIIKAKDNEIAVVLNDNANLINQIEAIYNSSSWKVTKSLRFVLSNAKKVRSRLMQKAKKITEKKVVLTDLNPKNRYYDTTVSIVIPSYNAENYFTHSFDVMKEQKGIREIEIVVVDSGSRDNTIKICKDYQVNLTQIPQSEFSHSYARNLGASKAKGEYIIFMTQDALPSNEYWVYNMLNPIINNNVVAVSCMEKPREDCELAYLVESENFAIYLGIENSDRIGSMPKDQSYESLRKNGQLNDVSCAVKKSVFDQFKYYGDYAEDLDLGVRLIKAGYSIALLSTEKVIHSHNRPCGYYLKRAAVDSKNLMKMFNDFPVMEHSHDEILGGVIYAYYKVVCALDYLKNNETGNTPGEFFQILNNYWTSSSVITNVPIEVLQFGKSYSDKTVDDFIKDVIQIYNEETTCEAYLIGHIIYYINHTLSAYVLKHYSTIDNYLKDQIIDTIFKRLVSICGNDLSVYTVLHSQDKSIKEIVEELQKGV